ncbi:MAG: hypothetical protein BYD32DRAFT_450402 [Podila humilis]|nr:MAG: hypothetical protein BYD32DRAFT_450402 [Podila humilis]
MEDAVILANALYEIREPRLKKITATFENQRSQRDPHAQSQFQVSKMFAMLMVGQISLNYVSAFFPASQLCKDAQVPPSSVIPGKGACQGCHPCLSEPAVAKPEKVNYRSSL